MPVELVLAIDLATRQRNTLQHNTLQHTPLHCNTRMYVCACVYLGKYTVYACEYTVQYARAEPIIIHPLETTDWYMVGDIRTCACVCLFG